MSLINGLVDRHPVNVVHMCTVHRGAEESTPALQRHCGGSFLRAGEQERVRWLGGGGGERKKREWEQRKENETFEALGSAVVKGSEWERRPCSQPHGPFSLGIMGAFSVDLNPLVACWERAAVRPPLTTDTLRHAHPLDNWILHPAKSPPFPWTGLPATRGPDRKLSQDLTQGKESESGPVWGLLSEPDRPREKEPSPSQNSTAVLFWFFFLPPNRLKLSWMTVFP